MSLCFDGGKQALQIEEQLASRFTVNREHYLPFARDERSYEVHREYIDVQFVREGCEDILLSWSLRTQEQPVFDPARDIAFIAKNPLKIFSCISDPVSFASFFLLRRICPASGRTNMLRQYKNVWPRSP